MNMGSIELNRFFVVVRPFLSAGLTYIDEQAASHAMKKLESTRKISVNSILRVYRKGFGYSKLTIIENSDFYLAGLVGEDFFQSVTEGDVIEAYLWVEDVASYEFNCRLIGRIVSGPRILFFSHTDQIVVSRERKCLTAQVDIPIRFFYFDPGDIHKSISSEEIVPHAGRVILLTDREATIKCDSEIFVNRFLKGHIRIGEEDIEMLGKVETINAEKDIINVLFAGMHEKDRFNILDYIFSHYRE